MEFFQRNDFFTLFYSQSFLFSLTTKFSRKIFREKYLCCLANQNKINVSKRKFFAGRKRKLINTGSMNDYFSEKTIEQNELVFEFFLYSVKEMLD